MGKQRWSTLHDIKGGSGDTVSLLLLKSCLWWCLRTYLLCHLLFVPMSVYTIDLIYLFGVRLKIMCAMCFLPFSGKLTVFTVLCEQYQPSLKRDPMYNEVSVSINSALSDHLLQFIYLHLLPHCSIMKFWALRSLAVCISLKSCQYSRVFPLIIFVISLVIFFFFGTFAWILQYLDRIGQLFFGVPPKQSPSYGGLLGEWSKTQIHSLGFGLQWDGWIDGVFWWLTIM